MKRLNRLIKYDLGGECSSSCWCRGKDGQVGTSEEAIRRRNEAKGKSQFHLDCRRILDRNEKIAVLQAERDALIAESMKKLEIKDFATFNAMYIAEVK